MDYNEGFRAACVAACKIIEAECSGWNDEARRAFKKIDELRPGDGAAAEPEINAPETAFAYDKRKL